ncbi:FMR1-interacting protein NUFIP1 isoform X1 [Cataglyphis hispanica]|uniref:FMR1-interacting protein NUFIP1 isoform X1 n=1 Tax=Cataglyphis hispanica TaxID=1086592 RepID=UPI0021808C2F|nr:FMR1-interacting protein NUFIP1 isoform X1 [Cataglyphis hispanica]
MSPLNRGSPLGSRILPAGARPLPPPRFGGRPAIPQRVPLPPRMPSPPRMRRMPPMNPMFGPVDPRQRIPPPPPPPLSQPSRPVSGGGGISRLNGVPPLFPGGLRARGHLAPIAPPMGPRGPFMRPWPRRMLPPQMMPPMRPMRYNTGNASLKGKPIRNAKKINNRAESDLIKKSWMTDEIRHEIQKKTRLYLRAKKYQNKNTVEWQEFRDTRNKVTRMIRDAKNEYFAKHPEQVPPNPADEETENQGDENCASSNDKKSYYCEVCDRDFPSKDTLSEHKSTHRVCGIDGCTFSAHPMLVEKHISMQHRTGLYQRMKDLSIPENLEKWLMERKKRYPTEANINLRKAEELEKLQRGEIIKQNSNVHTRTNKTVNVRQKKRRPRKRYGCENNNYVHTDELYRGLHPFPGTSVLQEGNKVCIEKEGNKVCIDEEVGLHEETDLYAEITGNISDEDDILQTSTTLEATNLPAISSPILPILVANYESESDDEAPEEVPVKRMKIEELQQDKITKNTIDEEISDIQKCENDKLKSDKLNNESQKTVVKYQNEQKHEMNRILIDNKNNKLLRRYHNKLLEKLLSHSIQHERNLICQCIKYIIDNNFFDLN